MRHGQAALRICMDAARSLCSFSCQGSYADHNLRAGIIRAFRSAHCRSELKMVTSSPAYLHALKIQVDCM